MSGKQSHNRIETEFEQLFHSYADVIYRLALYKTSHEDTARDITQEAFTRLWQTLKAGKELDRPKSYLYQIARNLITDHYKRKRSLSLDQLRDDGFDPAAQTGSTDLEAEISILRADIQSLEEEFQEAIYLRLVEGLKVKEIAEFLNVSENLVSVRINRGKKKLQAKWQGT